MGGTRRVWIVACDYETGRRVPFGRRGAPRAEFADAVAASCAIPGFYMPVRIGGRDYVDGGIYSPSNLDLLRAEGLDLVICLNPTSTIDEIPVTSPLHRMAAAVRGASGRRLGREARRVRAGGARVLLVQPTREDVQTMGPNLMSGRNRHQVGAHRRPHDRGAPARARGARPPGRSPGRRAPQGGSPGWAAVRVAGARPGGAGVRRPAAAALALAVLATLPATAGAQAPEACLGDTSAEGVPKLPGPALRFGINPAGEAGALGPRVEPVPDDPARTLAALARLRAPHTSLVVRLNRFFWSDGEAGIQRFLALARALCVGGPSGGAPAPLSPATGPGGEGRRVRRAGCATSCAASAPILA